jgi:dihydrofolate synthase/folylpolyglutamate synthase
MQIKATFPPPRPDPFGRLAHIPKFGSGIGLHRTRFLLDELEPSPWLAALKTIRVTGSNGKGSVCAMLSSIFEALSVSCGLYTSPHLIRFNERFMLNGQPIADDELSTHIDWLLERCESYKRLHPDDTFSAFEPFTALAMKYFSAHSPQVVVAEAGIGGRYDATRALPGDLVGLVSLDLEHTELLGDSLEQIAYNKADLCPDGGTVVVGQLSPDVLRRLQGYCAVRKITLVDAHAARHVENISYSPEFMSLDLWLADMKFKNLRMSLKGPHQVNNAVVAILLARLWLRQNLPQIDDARFSQAVNAGLCQTRWPGRFERICDVPPVYVDAGHTPDGMDQLASTVRVALKDTPILLVTGVSRDKKVAEIISRLTPLADEVICTRAHHKGSPVSVVYEAVQAAGANAPVHSAESIEEAVELACEIALQKGMTVLVAGGLFLAVEASQAFRGEDPRALRFF